MTETTMISIPCRVITLRVELGKESGASTLEELVLRAVAGKRSTVHDLGELFSLPHRLMLDVVHGLWSRGFLAVDFASNTLESTQAAEAVLGGQGSSRAVSTRVKSSTFLFDPVTATVLTEKGSKHPPHGSLEMPPARGISEDDLPQTELLRAVRQAVENDRRKHGVRERVLNVSFANPVLSPLQMVRWRTVEAVVKHDPATGMITATPVEVPAGWGRRGLELFQSRITDLVHNRPQSRFVRALVAQQNPEDLRPDSLRALILELETLAEGLATVPDDEVPSRHDALRTRVGQVVEEIAEARRARCSASPVAAKGGVDWVVSDLIERAEHQVVLALPHIVYDALHPVLPTLELAVKRGVRLVILWGDHENAKLEPRVATALFDLQARYRHNVLLERRSSRSAASAIISDNRAAYVGSRSVLSQDTGSGVLVEPADGSDTPPQCVTDLLSWARRTFPHRETGRHIALDPADFGRRERAAEESRPDQWRRAFTVPELDEQSWHDDDIAARTRWTAGWGRLLRSLVTAVEDIHRGDPVVRTVWDGMYIGLVKRLIPATADRLAVTDDRAEPEACGDRIARQLTELRDREAVVHLQHPPLTGSRRADPAYTALLARLNAEKTLRRDKARARAVLSDHEVVVGSHRLLGSRAVNPARGPAPFQLALHIVGTGFTADFARELGIPDWYGSAARLPAYLPPLPALAATPVRDDPWTVLAGRRDAEEPEDVLRRESAALLLGTTDGGAERQEWGRWLLRDAWERGAFMEAYALAPLLGSGDGTLSAELAAVAVPLEHGPLGYRLYESAVELGEAPPEHRTVALVGAVAEMLLYGGSTGKETCEVLTEPGGLGEGLPEPWLRLAGAALACFGAVPAPLPLDDINVWAAHREHSAELRDRRAGLATGLDDFEQVSHHFTFQNGEKLHRALFQPGRLLARVREMTLPGADPGPRALAGLPRSEREVRALMDQLAGELGLRKIEWRHHMVYARRVADFLSEARAIAPLTGTDDTARPAPSPGLNTYQREFARYLDGDWHQLLAATDDLGGPARLAARTLLEKLSALPRAGVEDA
ncbi:hypothetical protein [Streptomyces sp. NPDC059452]|uniref:hypothetical protein n=1 Tax=Streptomyces sp. NPDC059452 TaxID=3346835 RepID=UPI0036876E15